MFSCRNLLANLDLITRRSRRHSSISLETSWHTAGLLINDVKAELVKLTPVQMTFDSKPSPLSSFLRLEAQTLSQHILITRSVIDGLEQVLIGNSAACPFACDMLKAIDSHRMPELGIHNAVDCHQDLFGWIRKLQQRLTTLPLSRYEDSYMFEVNMFCQPDSFLDAVLRHLARQQFKSLHSVYLTAHVVRNTLLLFT